MRVHTHMYEYEHIGLIPFSIPQEALAKDLSGYTCLNVQNPRLLFFSVVV